MKNPPILISVIGFFAVLRLWIPVLRPSRVLGFDWFGALGDLPPFEHVGLGWLVVATGIIWILVALGLWALQPWARRFAQIIAGFALFEAVLAFFQFLGTGIGFAMAIMPALILWYLSTSEVKAAFGLVPGTVAASEPAAAPLTFASPAAPAAPPASVVVVAAPVAIAAAPVVATEVPAPVAEPVPGHQQQQLSPTSRGSVRRTPKTRRGRHRDDRRPPRRRCQALRLRRKDRGGHWDQQQAHPRSGSTKSI